MAKRKRSKRKKSEHTTKPVTDIMTGKDQESVKDSDIIIMTFVKYLGSSFMVTGLINYFYGSWKQPDVLKQIPPLLVTICTILLFSFSVIHIFLTNALAPQAKYLESVYPIVGPDVTKYKRYKQLSNVQFFLAILIAATAILPYLYLWGIPTAISNFLSKQFPNLAQTVVSTLTASITFIIASVLSGVIGNLAYDLIKSYVTKKMKE